MENGVGATHTDAAPQALTVAAAARPPPSIWRQRVTAQSGLLAVIALAVSFAGMRCVGMLGPSSLRPLLPASFLLMTIAPWLLLNRDGRRAIGLRAPDAWAALAPAVITGAVAALACFAAGLLMFGHSADNWFMTIAASYRGMMSTASFSVLTLHLVFTVPALLFSPIGEEIFFRGLLQRALEQRLSVRASTLVECGAFGLVHLCHHGLVLAATGLTIRPVSGALWVGAMFLVALLFAAIRQRTGSLFLAMAAHATFNGVMNTVIFAFLR